MEWLWELYKEYVTKELERSGRDSPTEEEIQKTFLRILSESTISVLVQEPWQNTVRFKGLAKCKANKMMDLVRDPMRYLQEKFGGGKFKLNFHHGWNFVATKNFKPKGEPKWIDMTAIEF